MLPFYTPWKSQKDRFSDVFEEYRKGTLAWNRLICSISEAKFGDDPFNRLQSVMLSDTISKNQICSMLRTRIREKRAFVQSQ